MAFGLGKKVPMQGGSGKASVQPVKKSTVAAAKPGKSEIKFGYARSGQSGSGSTVNSSAKRGFGKLK